MVNVTVLVDHRGLDPALRALKKALDRTGTTQEVKRRQHHTAPSEARRQKKKRARTRAAKRTLRDYLAGAREQPQGRRLTRQIRRGRGKRR